MIASVKNDLSDATESLEHLLKKYDDLTMAEKVDVGARVNAIAKSANALVELVKVDVKARRKGNEGEVKGEVFKAVLKLVDTTRLDQKGLKEERPEIHAAYNKDVTDERVTFEAR
jgi:hypothetical protein